MPIRTQIRWPLLALAAFLVLLGLVVAGWEPLYRLDNALSARFRAYGAGSPRAIEVIRVLTDVMGTYAFLGIGFVATVALWRGQPRAARFCAAVTVTVPLSWSVMHALLHRPRPVDGFVSIGSNGFPSGHTAHAAATALTAVLLLWPRLTPLWRAVAVALGVAFAVSVGLTRVVLLAHWPADVLGGWLLALTVVPLLARYPAGLLGFRADEQCEPRQTGGDQKHYGAIE